MGHQHFFSPPYMLEAENDQTWNLTDYMHTARSGAGESSSLIYPSDNMSIDGAQYTSHTYSSLPHNLHTANYQQDIAGPSNLSMNTSSNSSFYITPQDYRNQASSSNYNGNPFNEEDLFDIRVGNGRTQYKRKSPGVPEASGSSSDVAMLTEPWQETRTTNFLQAPWDYNNNNNNNTTNPVNDHQTNGVSIGGESSLRNVRSRAAFDLETNNLSREYYTTSRPMDASLSPLVDLTGQTSNGLTMDWNPSRVSSAIHDNSLIDCESNPFLVGSSNINSSLNIGQQNNNNVNNNNNHNNNNNNNQQLITRSNHTLQSFQGGQSVRGVRSSYSQRPISTFRGSSSNLRLGHTDEGLQLATNSYSSRNPRSSSTIGNGRARMSSERYRSFSGSNFHDRAAPEGLMIVDRSGLYGSRNPFDQHRDMRLDIDDMSYEELLALGERIGSVGTGIPEHLISKCVQESIYCSSDQIQEEGTCVICLEEYANMDDIGMLKGCGHDFHVGCIKKWLSMKNLCPICKAEPMKQK